MPDYDKLNAAIDAFEETAYGSDSDGTLSAEREAAINAYLGVNVSPAPDGRSQVIDRSVYETVQWIVPSLCRVFANGDDVIEIPPTGPEDEQGAKQEGQYLNYILLQKNPWFEVYRTAAMDSLMVKSGYLYAFRDKRRTVEMERYERQTPESLALLFQDSAIQVIDAKEYPDPDAQQAQPQPDPMTGQMIVPPPPMLYDVQVRRTREDNAFKVIALPPERCKIAEETPSWHLADCPFFEYYEDVPISDLRAEGFDVPDDIADDSENTNEATARDLYNETNDTNTTDPAMRRVRKRMIWVRYDYDEDGISEMQYVVRVGTQILAREECNRIPVAVLASDPLPHRHIGLCPADITIPIQDTKTAILRQGMDNLYLTNNSRTYVNPQMVNVDDLMNSRPGGIVRGKGVFGQDIAPIVTPFMFDKAMAGLEYMDQIRENRTGVNRYFTGIDQNALNKTATGISQLTSMAAQRVEQIARTHALGIEQLGCILHELVLKAGHKKEAIRLRGQWVEVDPASWKNRYDFRISVTYAAGNKDAQLAQLQLIANYQAQAMSGGVPIVTPQNLYETAVEMTKAANMSSPERFWTEPSKIPPPQPPQPDPTVMAVEQLKAQVTTQTKTMETQQRERDSIRDAELKKYEIDTDAQVKLGMAERQAQVAQEAEQFRHVAAVDLESRKAELNPKNIEGKAKAQQIDTVTELIKALAAQQAAQSESFQQSLQQMITALTAPRRVVRGQDGRAMGTEVVR